MIWGPYNMITPRRVKFPSWKDNKANVLSISYSSGWGLWLEMSALLSVYGENLRFINTFDTKCLSFTSILTSHCSFFRNWAFICLSKFVWKLTNKGNHHGYHQILGSNHFPYQTFTITDSYSTTLLQVIFQTHSPQSSASSHHSSASILHGDYQNNEKKKSLDSSDKFWFSNSQS